VVILPSLGLLYRLDQQNLLPEEGADEVDEAAGPRASAPGAAG
jgi:hypothetical protein